MPTLADWPEESRNYHVLRALILSCQIFSICNHYSEIRLFHVIVTVYFFFYDNFFNYTSKEERLKGKNMGQNSVILLF